MTYNVFSGTLNLTQPATSHSAHHDETAMFIRLHCSSRPVTEPLTCSQSSHQPSPVGLDVKASAGLFQVASICGDSYFAKDTPLDDDDDDDEELGWLLISKLQCEL